jgi:metal-sulfur cluster biosynthetic enzyme
MSDTKEIIETLKTVFDPEMPINIWDLGLIYGVNFNDELVEVTMTFTSPNCPFAESILNEIKTKLLELENVNEVKVEIVWEPVWSRDSLDDEMLLELGLA